MGAAVFVLGGEEVYVSELGAEGYEASARGRCEGSMIGLYFHIYLQFYYYLYIYL